MPKKIGLLVGREWSFPPAFVDAVARQGGEVTAEYLKLGTPSAADPGDFAVILDRFSRAVPFYRSYLRAAERAGTRVMNPPAALDSIDQFLGISLASRLGYDTPPAALLPHRDYATEIVHEESLRNLDYPLDWQALVDRVGAPFELRDAGLEEDGEAAVCSSVEELLSHYDRSGRRLLMVQGIVPAVSYARCLVVGRGGFVLPYDPEEGRYLHGRDLPTELGETLLAASVAISRSMMLDLNTVEWGVTEDGPVVIRPVDPFPELDVYALTEPVFDQVVEAVARLAVDEALRPAPADGRAERSPTVGDGAGDLAEELGSLARGLPKTKL